MNESNKPRQARMDRGKSRIIFCPLRDDLPRYSARQHHSSKTRRPQVLWLQWRTQTNKHSDGSISIWLLIACGSGTLNGSQNTLSHLQPLNQFNKKKSGFSLLLLGMSCNKVN